LDAKSNNQATAPTPQSTHCKVLRRLRHIKMASKPIKHENHSRHLHSQLLCQLLLLVMTLGLPGWPLEYGHNCGTLFGPLSASIPSLSSLDSVFGPQPEKRNWPTGSHGSQRYCTMMTRLGISPDWRQGASGLHVGSYNSVMVVDVLKPGRLVDSHRTS
jgi:hypothetical protein